MIQINCLKCKRINTLQTIGFKETEDFIITRYKCQACGAVWKDYKGANDENSPCVQIQRNSNSSLERSPSTSGKDKPDE